MGTPTTGAEMARTAKELNGGKWASGLKMVDSFSGDQTEWRRYKVTVSAYCKMNGIFEVKDGTIPAPAEGDSTYAAYTRINQYVYSVIIATTRGTAAHLVLQADEDDGHGAWKLLLNRYEQKSRSKKIALVTELMSLSLGVRGQDPDELFDDIKRITSQLSYWDNMKAIDDDWLIGVTIKALPPSTYNPLITAMEQQEKLTFEDVKQRVRAYYARTVEDPSTREEVSAYVAVGAGKGKFKGECHFCGQRGHKKADCRKYSKQQLHRPIDSTDDGDSGEPKLRPKAHRIPAL